MRVVVVGASGNAGTALLRALADEPAITSVLGLARRLPDQDAEPYSSAQWATIDVGRQAHGAEEETLVGRLAELFAGADAVVNLAWLLQPNHERNLLRRTNVAGSSRVARAVAQAGVPHLVVASSVGAYSGVDDDVPRDESWRTGGFPTSHYSVDKVAQERALDAFESAHPEVTVTRLRPALIFQRDAGAEITRYFLGRLVPLQPLRDHRLPVMPVPAGLRVQVVHAADAAQAYLKAILARAGGAFNIAAEPLLRAQDLADVVDHGRVLEVPPRLLRPPISLAWQARLLPTDPGWLDLAMGVPVMDTTRARTELRWSPRHEARDTLAELIQGMADGAGGASPPMHPRSSHHQVTSSRGRHARPTPAAAGGATMPQVPDAFDNEQLGMYLTDHVTGATGGLSRFERMTKNYTELPMHDRLVEVTEQVRAELNFLRELIQTLGLGQRPHRQAAAWFGEQLATLRTSGHLFAPTPMSVVLECELMRSAVLAKLGLWETLTDLSGELGLDAEEFRSLADQARGQAQVLSDIHEHARTRVFRKEHDLSA